MSKTLPWKAVKKIVTNQIMNLANEKLPPWQMPFTQDLPMNYIRKTQYHGSNFFTLSLFAQLWGCRNKWLTYPQALAHGLQFSHESAGHFVTVIHAHFLEDPDTLEKQYRGMSVWSVSSIDYLVTPPPPEEVGLVDPIILEPQMVIDNMPFKCGYTEEHGRAYYSPNKHLVNVPPPSDFKKAEERYAVLFHEYSHATGHPSLLNRFPVTYVMPEKGEYAKEELNAEMSTMFLCAQTGISRETETNSKAYCKSWWGRIKEDPDILLESISAGQKIADYILGTKYEKEQENKDE